MDEALVFALRTDNEALERRVEALTAQLGAAESWREGLLGGAGGEDAMMMQSLLESANHAQAAMEAELALRTPRPGPPPMPGTERREMDAEAWRGVFAQHAEWEPETLALALLGVKRDPEPGEAGDSGGVRIDGCLRQALEEYTWAQVHEVKIASGWKACDPAECWSVSHKRAHAPHRRCS